MATIEVQVTCTDKELDVNDFIDIIVRAIPKLRDMYCKKIGSNSSTAQACAEMAIVAMIVDEYARTHNVEPKDFFELLADVAKEVPTNVTLDDIKSLLD